MTGEKAHDFNNRDVATTLCGQDRHATPAVSKGIYIVPGEKAQDTPAATRQESLNGLVACLEAKELAAVIQASVELGALGAAATCAVPKLVELARPAFLGTASPRPPSRR